MRAAFPSSGVLITRERRPLARENSAAAARELAGSAGGLLASGRPLCAAVRSLAGSAAGWLAKAG
jgi:hypothetical protein